MVDLRRSAAALVALAALAAPATAAGGWSTTVRATSDGCTSARMVAGSDGVSRGFAQCEGATYTLAFVSGQGTSWRTTKATSFGGLIHDVADDGTATYALVDASQPERGLHLVKRTRGGRVTTQRLTDHGVTDYGGGSVVAKGGAWWAVWPEPDPNDPHTVRLYQARTMGGTQGRTVVVPDGFNKLPSLALRSGGGVLLAWRKEATQSIGDVWLGTNPGGGWSMRKQIPDVTMPVLATSGSRVMLLYTPWLGGCPCPLRYVESRDGRTFGSPHAFTAKFRPLGRADRPRIASADGRTFVAFTTPEGHYYSAVVAEKANGRWTETNAVTGWRAVGDVTAAAGRATLFVRQEDKGSPGWDLASTRVYAAPPKPAATTSRATVATRAPSPAATPSPPPVSPSPSPVPIPSAATATPDPTGSAPATRVSSGGGGALPVTAGAVVAALLGGAGATVAVRRRRR